MGLGVEEEPPAWVCAIQAVLLLLLVPLIPVALVAYVFYLLARVTVAVSHRQYRIKWHELQDICLPLAAIVCVPFLYALWNLFILTQKAGRRIADACGISPHPRWLRRGYLLARMKDEEEEEEQGRANIVKREGSPTLPSLYAPLESDYDVRLLRIEPAATVEEPFVLSLCTASLLDRPQYDALSYTWADDYGDSDRIVSVVIRQVCSSECDDTVRIDEFENRGSCSCADDDRVHNVFITKNCESALRRLRLTVNPRYMWIDALCINQADVAERTHQVSLMSRIYVGAEHVVVYTGEATPLTDRLFDALNQLPREEILEPPSLATFFKRFINGNTPSVQKSHPVEQLISSDDIAELAATYFSRRWFQRVWVLQEVSLPDPRRTRILCGAKTTTATRALQAIPLMQHHLPKTRSRALHIFLLVRQNQQQMLPFTTSLLPVGPMRCSPLLDILIATRDRQSTDPRDRIFGVLSLASGLEAAMGQQLGMLPPSPADLKADYGLSVAQVYTRYSEFFIAKHGAGFFLALLLPRDRRPPWADMDRKDKKLVAGLPSWTADWSNGLSCWLNERAVRGFDFACSGRENIEKKKAEEVRFRDDEGSGRRVMVWEQRRSIKRGWFSRNVADGDGGRNATMDIGADVMGLKMDPSLALVSMYPGVAALLRKSDEDGAMFDFLQVCAYARDRQDVANIVDRWSDVVVRGADRAYGDNTAEFFGELETFQIS